MWSPRFVLLGSLVLWPAFGRAAEPQAGENDVTPRFVTLQGKGIGLDKALQELAEQTGNLVEDRRQAKVKDLKLDLDLTRATFWQALDQIAGAAGLRISLYEKDGKIALREGPSSSVPVSYSGVFRIAVGEIRAVRNLDTKDHSCAVHLEIAWEPRFQPLFLENRPDSLVVLDDKGTALKVEDTGSVRIPVAGRIVTEKVIRMEAPPRSVSRLGLLQGSFAMWGPSRMLAFTFDDLVPVIQGEPRREQSRDGVTVRVQDLSTASDPAKVRLMLTYPPENPEFDSFESWLVNNQIFLERKDRKPVPPSDYESAGQAGRRAVFTYYFKDSDVVGTRPEDWKMTYQTPGIIVKVPVKFAFKDLPLP